MKDDFQNLLPKKDKLVIDLAIGKKTPKTKEEKRLADQIKDIKKKKQELHIPPDWI